MPYENSPIVQLIKERRDNQNSINDLKTLKKSKRKTQESAPTNQIDLNEHIAQRKGTGSSAGMPYGLPPLTDKQIETLTLWVNSGAPMPAEGSYYARNVYSNEKRQCTN